MIIYDMALQWRLLAYSVLVGLALGVFYDALRLSRLFLSLPASPTSPKYYRILSQIKLFRRSRQVAADISDEPDNAAVRVGEFAVGVVAFAEDLLFFTVCAIVMTVFIFHANTGSPRGFMLLGASAGFTAYLFTLGRITLFFGELIVFLTRELLSWIYILLLLPIAKGIKHAAFWLYTNTAGRIASAIQKRILQLKTESRAKELRSCCARLSDIIIEQTGGEVKNEAYQNEHSGQAHDIPGLRVSDNHIRERGNKIQQARGGACAAPKPNRASKRQHRGSAEQT